MPGAMTCSVMTTVSLNFELLWFCCELLCHMLYVKDGKYTYTILNCPEPCDIATLSLVWGIQFEYLLVTNQVDVPDFIPNRTPKWLIARNRVCFL